jgi:hypothetical protein
MGDNDTIKIEIINDYRYIYVDSVHNLNISLFTILRFWFWRADVILVLLPFTQAVFFRRLNRHKSFFGLSYFHSDFRLSPGG